MMAVASIMSLTCMFWVDSHICLSPIACITHSKQVCHLRTSPISGHTSIVGSLLNLTIPQGYILRAHLTTPGLYLRFDSSRLACRDPVLGRHYQIEQSDDLPRDLLTDQHRLRPLI